MPNDLTIPRCLLRLYEYPQYATEGLQDVPCAQSLRAYTEGDART